MDVLSAAAGGEMGRQQRGGSVPAATSTAAVGQTDEEERESQVEGAGLGAGVGVGGIAPLVVPQIPQTAVRGFDWSQLPESVARTLDGLTAQMDMIAQ